MSTTPSNIPILPRLKKESIKSLVAKGLRLDGRRLDEYRKIVIETNYVPKAEGSALVKLGNTVVLVGVKMEVGTPFPDTPNEGVLTVNAEFVPLASPSFEPGPPDENAIELARVIDRSLREIRVIDLGKLALIPGEKVWIVWVDIYILNHDGNLLDASALAAMAALMTTRIPKVEVGENEVKVDKKVKTSSLPLNHRVVTVTVGKLGEYLLVDPTEDEELVLDAKIAISVSEDGKIAGIQKMGPGDFTIEEVEKAASLALKAGNELHRILSEYVKI